MKKKLCVLVLALCMTASFTACSSDKKQDAADAKTQEEQDAKEDSDKEEEEDKSAELTEDTRLVSVSADELGEYITLGEYKGIELQEEVAEVTEEDIQAQIERDLSMNLVEKEGDDVVVEEGDTVNIDYEGKKDGVAFEGGTAEGYDLAIGSGTFIEGFEEGLIGAKKGEVRDLNLTFPENYQAEDLAGQAVVFTVTVNEIKTQPELTDDWVKENTEYDNLKAYKDGVYKKQEESNKETAKNVLINTAWGKVMDASEVKKYPEKDLEAAKEEYRDSLKQYAEQMNMEMEEALSSQGMTQEQFDEQCKEYAEYSVKQMLVAQAIMDAEKINLVDDKSKEIADDLLAQFGVESLSDMVDSYGQNTVNTYIAMTRVTEFIIDNGKVETKVSTEDDKNGYDADAAEELELTEDSAEDSSFDSDDVEEEESGE